MIDGGTCSIQSLEIASSSEKLSNPESVFLDDAIGGTVGDGDFDIGLPIAPHDTKNYYLHKKKQ